MPLPRWRRDKLYWTVVVSGTTRNVIGRGSGQRRSERQYAPKRQRKRPGTKLGHDVIGRRCVLIGQGSPIDTPRLYSPVPAGSFTPRWISHAMT
jgi:hypothetical protein